MKIIRIKNHITVVLSDGTMLNHTNCTDEMYNKIVNNQDNDDFVRELIVPEYAKKKEEVEIKTKMLNDFKNSKYISSFGNSVYIKSISELTVPEDLAMALFKAEQENDTELVQTYLNFWTLASLNPDSRARTNLFWFLKRYGMTISKSGLFVAYRNVELKKQGSQIDTELAKFVSEQYIRVKTKLKKAPSHYVVGYQVDLIEEDNLIVTKDKNKCKKILGKLDELYLKLSDENVAPVYTDAHTGKFTIKIGEVVSMPREKCDSVQENTCSNGLHVAGRSWLSQGYFGRHSLMVLVNPADVVAVPPEDNYGKMRVCAYYPVQLIQRDKSGQIINTEINDGFEDDFMEKICYTGNINNQDDGNYSIVIPEIPEINKSNITSRLKQISSSLKKYVN